MHIEWSAEPQRRQLRVLMADDDATNRLLLEALLEDSGYEAIVAENGLEAVELFDKEKPDMVLMDVMMPVMDGYQAASLIKQKSKDDFAPLIFLTAITDEEALAKCVEVGGDDFMTKPYNRITLNAKLNAFSRLRELYQTVKTQRDKLEYYQEMQHQEHLVARKIFENIVHRGGLDTDSINYILSPMALFNGDMLLAENTPTGSLRVMLGDFTGHGLSASIGAMPASAIFYSMTSKGFDIPTMAIEINRKLKATLPTGMFLAACIVELDYQNGAISVWNGGIPAAFMFSNSGFKKKLVSDHLPMGILGDTAFDTSVQLHELNSGDRLILCTDGVTEAKNPNDEMLGEDRLVHWMEQQLGEDKLDEKLLAYLAEFQGHSVQSDDLTYVDIKCTIPMVRIPEPVDDVMAEIGTTDQQSLAAWRMDFDFFADTLKRVDPVPLINEFLNNIGLPDDKKEQVYMVLAELFSNALDHGILGLDSELKKTADGFAVYYEQRAERLDGLDKDAVNVCLALNKEAGKHVLVVKIKDTGNGFDVSDLPPTLEENAGHSGRGIALVRKMCRCVEYNDVGNEVLVEFVLD